VNRLEENRQPVTLAFILPILIDIDNQKLLQMMT